MPRPCRAETGNGSPRPEGPQVGGVGLAGGTVDLVGAEHDRLAGLAEQADHLGVGLGDADRGVDDEDHGVGQRDRDLGLLGDARLDAGDVDLPAAGVDEREPRAGPVGRVAHAVARDAGLVLDDGLAAAEDAVDEGRLADVRAADDGEHGEDDDRLLADLADVARVQEGKVLVLELVLGEAGAQRPLTVGVAGLVGQHQGGSGSVMHPLSPVHGPRDDYRRESRHGRQITTPTSRARSANGPLGDADRRSPRRSSSNAGEPVAEQVRRGAGEREHGGDDLVGRALHHARRARPRAAAVRGSRRRA